MDKDLLYRFFEGRASVEEMRLVKEWSEASEENSNCLLYTSPSPRDTR